MAAPTAQSPEHSELSMAVTPGQEASRASGETVLEAEWKP